MSVSETNADSLNISLLVTLGQLIFSTNFRQWCLLHYVNYD